MKQQSQCCDDHIGRDDHSEWANVADVKLKEPATVMKEPASPDKDKWMNTMKKIELLYTNDVWDLVEQPKIKKPLTVSGCSSAKSAQGSTRGSRIFSEPWT